MANAQGAFTNCILANVINYLGGYNGSVSGGHNGFYKSPTFGTNTKTNTFYPFQTVGAGSYYLTNGCAFTNAGTASIDPTLLAALCQKTTHPPMVYSNVVIGTNLTLSPQATRDTNAAPDLGYHYDPIDYIVDQLAITNATLTLTNGVAVASYNEAGVQLQDGSAMVSIGSPLDPNWWVRYASVQEQPASLGGTNNAGGMEVTPVYTSVMPNGQYQFTKFACPAGGGTHLYDCNTSSYGNLTAQECEFWGGSDVLGGTNSAVMTLDNNLFARSVVNAAGSGALAFSNNLVWGASSVQLNPATGSTWNAFNNDFDSTTITNSTLTNGYNAYLGCGGRLYPTNAYDIVLTNGLAYQTGPLGGFYQPTSSPLVNAGSTTADQVGLYHFTTQTNQVPETNSIVDIGYHYVATDGYGNPLDSNGDGIPDYLADANGNGVVDNGESPWMPPPTITSQPASQAVVLNSNAVFSVTAAGLYLNYQWYSNSVPMSGSTNASLSLNAVQTNGAGSYYVVVANPAGSVASSNAVLTVLVPPTIAAQPTNQVVIQGGNATFTVAANGTAPLSYQWSFNGTNISGATNASIVLNNVQTTNAGNYSVVVTNVAGSVTSSNAVLTVMSWTVDSDYDGVSDAQEILDGTDPFNPNSVLQVRLGYWPFDNTNTWAGSAGQLPLLATNVVGAPSWSTNAVLIDSTNAAILMYRDGETNGDANINLRCGTVRFWFKPDWSSIDQGGTGPQSEGRLIEVGTEGSTNGWWGLVVGAAGTNIYFGTQTNSITTLITNLATGISWASNVWHQVVLTYNSTNTALYIDGQAAVANGMGVAYYPGLTVRTNGFAIGSSAAGTNQAKGTFDELETFNYSLNQVAALTGYQAATSPPIITNQPASLTVVQGTNVTFSVGASGTAPLAYQWRYNGASIIGATTSSFTTNNVFSGSAGIYSVAVANFSGSVTSAPAVLTVNVPVSITQQPTNLTVVQGANATFSLGANGTPTLSYQWFFNGTNAIPWANGSVYSKLVAVPSDAGNYNASVTNLVGSVTSSNASLTVIVPPIITSQPTNLTVNLTNSATFGVQVSSNSTPPLSYQWLWNGSVLAGATNVLLTVTNVQATNVGYYSVVVTNAAGTNASTEASLTVTMLSAGFTNNLAIKLNGDAHYTNTIQDGRVLELTAPIYNTNGNAFFTTPVILASNASFSTFFSFRLSQGGGQADVDGVVGADGIVFVVQTLTNNVGGKGGGIGYLGITNSVGVEFDTWYNNGKDTNDFHC